MPGFDDLMSKYTKAAQEAKDKVDGTTTSEDSTPKISNLKIHAGFNLILGPIVIIYAVGSKIKVSKGPIFFKWFGNKVLNIIDCRQDTLDVPPQTYYSKDSQQVKIDWFINYTIYDAQKAFKEAKDIIKIMQEATETLISSYLKKFTAQEISEINKITMQDLGNDFFLNFYDQYGVGINALNSNNINVPSIQKIKQQEAEAASARTIREKASENEREIQKANAEAIKEINEKQLDVDKKRADIFVSAINECKDPHALAMIIGNVQNQTMDIHHYDDNMSHRHR